MEKKYKTEEDSETGGLLLRIIALKDFADVKKGDKGGLIKSEKNLSQEGDCWVYDSAKIYENAKVWGNAKICGKAQVFGNACVSENARICGEARVWENARISGKAEIFGFTWIFNSAVVSGDVKLWSPTNLSRITTSIKNDKDYIMLAIKKDLYVVSLFSDVKSLIDKDTISIDETNYINNIKTIRQLYEKEI